MTFFHASPEVINQLLCFLETYLSKAITNLYQSAKRENPARMHKAKVVKVVIPLSPSLLLLPEDMIPPHSHPVAKVLLVLVDCWLFSSMETAE